MSKDVFEKTFAALRQILFRQAAHLQVTADTPREYTVVTKTPSPFPQHEGRPMWFGSVRWGKAYVSFHLMPLYMNPSLVKLMSPSLKKQMRGKTCFQFKTDPVEDALHELERLTQAGIRDWDDKGWM